MDMIDRLKNDPDQDVADATDNTDVTLLQERKILSSKFQTLELEAQDRDRLLNERWVKEEEERKRRAEEEEENKFDFATYLLDKKPVAKKSTNKGLKNRVGGGTSSSSTKAGGLASRQLKSQNSTNLDSGPSAKRAKNMTKR